MVNKKIPVNDLSKEKANVGARLLEERQRLGLSQTGLAEQADVTKFTQLKYEKGESSPNTDYLHSVAAIGVDVVYVLTGDRAMARVEEGEERPQLDPRSQQLLLKFQGADDVGKTYIEGVAQLAAAQAEGRGAASPGAREVALAAQLSRAAGAVASEKDDPALWRAVARGLQTAPNANSRAHLSMAQWLDIVDQAYAMELAKRAPNPPRTAAKPRRKAPHPQG